MDLTCVSDTRIKWIAKTYLIVQTVAFLWMAPLVRFFGMKRGWLVLGTLQSAAFIGYYYIGDIKAALALTAFYGLAGARDAFSFTYIA